MTVVPFLDLKLTLLEPSVKILLGVSLYCTKYSYPMQVTELNSSFLHFSVLTILLEFCLFFFFQVSSFIGSNINSAKKYASTLLH